MKMIPLFYQKHLKSQLSLAEYLFLQILVNILQSIKNVNEEIIYVAIDRTNWSRINLFMVSVIWDKRAFPIYFKLLPKLGSSNQELNHLGLAPGVSFFIRGVKVTKTRGFMSFNVACKWKRKINGVAPKEGWFILTNFDALELAISAYKQRFDKEYRNILLGSKNMVE